MANPNYAYCDECGIPVHPKINRKTEGLCPVHAEASLDDILGIKDSD